MVTNYCKCRLRLLQLNTSILVEPRSSNYWFLSSSTFRIDYWDMASEEVPVELEAEVEKAVKFPNGKVLLVKLRKRQDGCCEVAIRSQVYVMNCFHELGIIHRSLNMEANLKKCEYVQDAKKD